MGEALRRLSEDAGLSDADGRHVSDDRGESAQVRVVLARQRREQDEGPVLIAECLAPLAPIVVRLAMSLGRMAKVRVLAGEDRVRFDEGVVLSAGDADRQVPFLDRADQAVDESADDVASSAVVRDLAVKAVRLEAKALFLSAKDRSLLPDIEVRRSRHVYLRSQDVRPMARQRDAPCVALYPWAERVVRAPSAM